ncbi:hypothetical protein NBRC111894_1070 [Sporolactobacillus inulinus]|uniref:Uncharacterized protein n=1 Tax=Sporolactobacillus inulinus TaxID=2078 RepID=A0A4Y1Z928_9BACL|nr:hypothetical protein NBRC111894_1070 [Sporolactobacillus inulinus]
MYGTAANSHEKRPFFRIEDKQKMIRYRNAVRFLWQRGDIILLRKGPDAVLSVSDLFP